MLSINIIIATTAILLSLVGIWQTLLSVRSDRARTPYFILTYVMLILFAGSNFAGQMLRGHPGPGFRAALYAANFSEFCFPNLLVYGISRYLLSLVDPDRRRRTVRIVLTALMVLHFGLVVVSQFTGLLYIIDADNIYRRSPGFFLIYLVILAMMSIDIWLLCLERKRLTQKERAAFWVYFTVPLAATTIQVFVYGYNLIVLATVVAGFVMYTFILSSQTEEYYRQQQENMKLKVDIMLSQMQPHFLYNTLGAIQALCEGNPAAEEATVKFARYLRGNMDALTAEGTIPFARELAHTRLYLELEQLRFEDALQVRYDLPCTDFELPTLTLQPPVENAVRHGIRGSKRGTGAVTIATREFPDRYEISVADDGTGFEPGAPQDDGRSHIGIQNVRDRLARVVGGELRIDSVVGQGTTATIILPRG